jgi:DNA-binding response OmpR family regulator
MTEAAPLHPDTPAPPDRILVVDDVAQNRLLVEAHLAAAGYAVSIADGGESALARFREQPPELVLLDILMPKMDGFETCRALRALPGGVDTPIVFLTALCDLGTHQAALEAGADDFLTKPINRTELLLRVRSLLRIRHLTRDLAATFDRLRDQADELERARVRQADLFAELEREVEAPLTRLGRDLEDAAESDAAAALRAARDAAGHAAATLGRLVAAHRRQEPATAVRRIGLPTPEGDQDAARDASTAR